MDHCGAHMQDPIKDNSAYADGYAEGKKHGFAEGRKSVAANRVREIKEEMKRLDAELLVLSKLLGA